MQKLKTLQIYDFFLIYANKNRKNCVWKQKIAPKNDFSRSLHLLPIGKVAATSWSCRVNFYDSFTTHLRLIYEFSFYPLSLNGVDFLSAENKNLPVRKNQFGNLSLILL